MTLGRTPRESVPAARLGGHEPHVANGAGVTGSIEPWDTLPTDVVLKVPAVAASLRVVRMVAATLVADDGFDIDEIDDVRMAVDELCAAVIESRPSSPLDITFRLDGHRLAVRVEADQPDPGATVPVDELRAAVLGATAGEHSFSLDGGRAVAWLTKQSEVAAAGHGHSSA
jgi:serine/threonine-protein kinase RsbW